MIVDEMIWARLSYAISLQYQSKPVWPLPPQLVCNQGNHFVIKSVFTVQ